MKTLNIDNVCTTFNSASNPAFASGSNFQVQVPSSTVIIAKPVSYDFRVLEEVDAEGKVKVRLQTQVWEHTNYGGGKVIQEWTDVPRVRVDVATGNVL